MLVGEVLKISTSYPDPWGVLRCKLYHNRPQVSCCNCHCQHICWPNLPLSARYLGSAITQKVARASAVADVLQHIQLKSGMVKQPAQLRSGLKLLISSQGKGTDQST